ncbi:MAG: hypothetical protein ACFFD2_15985 [Promethearchaeota archaeon]
MNLPVDVLEFVPVDSDYQNSEQGDKPVRLEDPEEEESHEIKDPWLLLIPVVGPVLFYVKNKTAIDYYIGVALGLVMSFVEFVIKVVMAVIEFLVMLILTFLMAFLWLIIRAILLALIFIMLAIEIISTVPFFLGFGLALLNLNIFSMLDAKYDVNWWAEYAKDTEIGYLEVEIQNILISISAWIYWEYWEFFDLYYPVSDMEYEMDNIFEMGTNDETPPRLHCGYIPIENSSLKYDFYTTYSDSNGHAPSYVKLHLISPSRTVHEFSMEKDPYYENDWFENEDMAKELYKLGVVYNKTIDFEEDITGEDIDGQWFYYFTTTEADGYEYHGVTTKYPSVYYSEIGPYIGDKSYYLFYPENPDTSVWDWNSYNFTVTGCNVTEGVVPENVTLNFVDSEGNVEIFEMIEIFTQEMPDFSNYSFFSGNTFTDYQVTINFSENFDFENDELLCYYYNASLSDGNYSLLFDGNNNWNTIEVKTIGDSGKPRIVGYKIERFPTEFWGQTWTDHDITDDFLSIINPFDTLVQMCEENVLRFTVYVKDPDGSHEDIYEYTNGTFEFKPIVKLTSLLDPEADPIEFEMVYSRHCEEEDADEYFVELWGDGEWTYDRSEESWMTDPEFGPGSWSIEFEVTDNDDNTGSLEADYVIWDTGSVLSMWKTMWGGVDAVYSKGRDDNDYLQFFGIWQPIITCIGFLVAAGCGASKDTRLQTVGRVIAIITALYDVITRVVSFYYFVENGDTGALLGLCLNSLFTMLIFIVVQMIAGVRNRKQYYTDDAGNTKYTGLKAMGGNWANMKRLIFGSIGCQILSFAMLLYCDTRALFSWGMLLPFLLLLGAGSKYPDKETDKHTAYILAIASFIAPLIASSLFSDMDQEMPFEDIIMLAPMEILGMLGLSMGLGVLLQIGGKQFQETEEITLIDGKYTKQFKELNPQQNSAKKAVEWFNLGMGLMSAVCLIGFMYRSGFLAYMKHKYSEGS